MSESQPALTSEVLKKAIRQMNLRSCGISISEYRSLRFLSKSSNFDRACPRAREWAAGKIAQLSNTVNP